MAIRVTKQHSEAYKVNDKGVIKNEMGDWIAPFHTLSPEEWDAFYKHLHNSENFQGILSQFNQKKTPS